MQITELLDKKHMTRYRLSKESGVPQATISDICSGKASIEKCTAGTVYKLAKALDVDMETLLYPEDSEPVFDPVVFDVYKSHVCHLVKDKGDLDFILDTLTSNEIRRLYDNHSYAEAFYLLAMVDYLSNINGIPLCTNYNDIRSRKLREILYPSGVLMMDELTHTDENRKACLKKAIPEFLHFNIAEAEIRNVC